MKKIRINGSVYVGENAPAFVIAEIGSNHNQSLQLAYETIDAAKESGADAVKFQSINVHKLYFRPSQETLDLHKKIDFPEDWHYLLKAYCDKKNILFFSSPTYLEAVDILEDINVSLYKLASAQIGTFPQIIERVAQTCKPVIISTGLVNSSEIKKVVEIFKKVGNHQFIILHCNSIYPTPYEKVYLPTMNTYQKMFGCIAGFSDHTLGIYAPIAAVANGAKVVEKHFTISRELPVPDAAFSLEPQKFKQMIKGIRAVEKMMEKDVRVKIEEEEQSFKNSIQTKLVLAKAKKAGDKIEEDDILFRRADEGIDCADLEVVLHSTIRIDLPRNSLLKMNHLTIENN